MHENLSSVNKWRLGNSNSQIRFFFKKKKVCITCDYDTFGSLKIKTLSWRWNRLINRLNNIKGKDALAAILNKEKKKLITMLSYAKQVQMNYGEPNKSFIVIWSPLRQMEDYNINVTHQIIGEQIRENFKLIVLVFLFHPHRVTSTLFKDNGCSIWIIACFLCSLWSDQFKLWKNDQHSSSIVIWVQNAILWSLSGTSSLSFSCIRKKINQTSLCHRTKN